MVLYMIHLVPMSPSAFWRLSVPLSTKIQLLRKHAVIQPFVAHMTVQLSKLCSNELTCTSLKCRAKWPSETDQGVTIIYTMKGVSIHRVHFDEDYWKVNLLPKLTSFYDNCVAPEIVSPVHVLGIPIRNLLNE